MDVEPPFRDLQAACAARDRDRAAAIIRAIVALQPRLGSEWETIARTAATLGEASSAITAGRYYVSEAPSDMVRRFKLGDIFIRFGRIKEAIELGKGLVIQAPNLARAHHFLGEALAQAGQIDAALDALRRAIDLRPASPYSWLVLCTLKTFTVDDPELVELREAVARTADVKQRGPMSYALGKALDDAGDCQAAFHSFAEGAALLRQVHPFDRAEIDEWLAEAQTKLDRGFFDALHPSVATSDRPIFIVGLPRSGTTLMQQILTAHSAVQGGAEMNAFRVAATALNDFSSTSLLNHDAPDAWTRIGSAYLHVLEERFGQGGRIVDKTLVHARWLGVIAHALPQARFVWMRRDPPAAAWSCFRTHFGKGQAWSWSLEDIGYYFRAMDQMHAHWLKEFPDRILTVRYEDLAGQPDVTIARGLAHVGLSDEPQTRAFHKSPSTVQTASTAQVRQPISTSTIANWRNYEEHLQPFFDTYERSGA